MCRIADKPRDDARRADPRHGTQPAPPEPQRRRTWLSVRVSTADPALYPINDPATGGMHKARRTEKGSRRLPMSDASVPAHALILRFFQRASAGRRRWTAGG